ncbi:hypothetical protein [Pseudoalteromonas tunicata]|jgi:hypothetical protein|uniref:Orphan protein n=1 Tax=Pseudoalteromonas tunicata D2 TaxID=87626 RepID=A4CF72_9GAMM|nr:hypothetical protein [Pseudoalteromonas tunicata]ATC96222.1 hypothetical protein PTUN_a3976 [Pseudoalteromonas tunicata]AXT31738.1 hypothetical protein D1819_13505 [Pseudoalteromonas tunicata]EAR26620.1 hypothetical protein PTD2_00387 [Pseudoalteromonas tunicata D2]MDP4985611.1 hypothetical protein [Pseudoalteromonas tunicata]
MKYFLILAACLISNAASALPTFFVGEAMQITKSDLQPITQFYKRENGVDKYAEVAYEVEFPIYGTYGLTEIDVELTGNIYSAWYSSNFGMKVAVFCNNTIVANDTSYGVRYEHASYLVKPQIHVDSYPIPDGCESIKIRMEKQGNLSRMYFTNIMDIDVRLYITNKF